MNPLQDHGVNQCTGSGCLEDSGRLNLFPLPRRISIMSACDFDPDGRPDLSASYFLLQQMGSK